MKKRWWLVALLGLLVIDVLAFRWWLQVRRDRSQDKVILAAARRYGVDPALVKAVVWRESQFNPAARGTVGEIGLMQVGEAAAWEWAAAEKLSDHHHEDLFDPKLNTLAGTWYLKKMLERYAKTDDPLPYALADYNAGRRNVLRWIKGAAETNSSLFLEQMDFPTTRAYIQTVLEKYLEYQKELK